MRTKSRRQQIHLSPPRISESAETNFLVLFATVVGIFVVSHDPFMKFSAELFTKKNYFIPWNYEISVFDNKSYFPNDIIIEEKTTRKYNVITGNYFYEMNKHYDFYSMFGFFELESGLWHDSVTKTIAKYFVLRDCYVNKQGLIVHNHTRCNAQQRIAMIPFTNGSFEASYPEGIYISTRQRNMFGHLLKDIFGPLLYVPNEVLKTVPFVVTSRLDVTYDLLKAFGVNISNVIKFKGEENYIHLDKMYTVSMPDAVNWAHGYTLRKLSQRLKESFNISNTKATKYVLMNREAALRNLANFKEFVNVVNHTYSEYDWEVWEDKQRSLCDVARMWNTAKFLFAPTGSNLDNCIFMQPHSTIHALFFDWYDFPIVSAVYSMEIFLVATRNRSCRHFRLGKCYVNFAKTLRDMRVSLYSARYECFPPREYKYY